MGKSISELQVGDKVTRWGGGGYGRPEGITGIHTITKITKTSITTEDGRRYNHGGSEWGSSRGTCGPRGAYIEPYREEHDALLVAHRERRMKERMASEVLDRMSSAKMWTGIPTEDLKSIYAIVKRYLEQVDAAPK